MPFDSKRASEAAKRRHEKYRQAAEVGTIEAAEAAVNAKSVTRYQAWLFIVKAQAVKALAGDTRAALAVGKWLQTTPEGNSQVTLTAGAGGPGLEITPELRVLVDMVRERASSDPAFAARLEAARAEVVSR